MPRTSEDVQQEIAESNHKIIQGTFDAMVQAEVEDALLKIAKSLSSPEAKEAVKDAAAAASEKVIGHLQEVEAEEERRKRLQEELPNVIEKEAIGAETPVATKSKGGATRIFASNQQLLEELAVARVKLKARLRL